MRLAHFFIAASLFSANAALADDLPPDAMKLLKLSAIGIAVQVCDVSLKSSTRDKLEKSIDTLGEKQTSINETQFKAATEAMAKKIVQDKDSVCKEMQASDVDAQVLGAINE